MVEGPVRLHATTVPPVGPLQGGIAVTKVVEHQSPHRREAKDMAWLKGGNSALPTDATAGVQGARRRPDPGANPGTPRRSQPHLLWAGRKEHTPKVEPLVPTVNLLPHTTQMAG